VAAAVASLFAEELVRAGVPEGVELRALVFLVIGATVIVQGLGGAPLAALLRVRRPSDAGYLLVGANAVARALGRSLQSAGEQIALVDTDPEEVVAAQRMGLHAVLGNALDDEVLESAELEGRRGLISLIPNEAVGLMVAEKARREFRIGRVDLTVRPGRSSLVRDRLGALRAGTLFGVETDLLRWAAELGSGRAESRRYRYVGEDELAVQATDRANDVLCLAVEHRERAAPVNDRTRLRRGDIVTLLTTRPLDAPRGLEAAEEPTASLEA
jgi:Trk K+ transport system NAD-binding subunit